MSPAHVNGCVFPRTRERFRVHPDFFQHDLVTTIHDLHTGKLERLEDMLKSTTESVGLVLPVTASDMRAEPFSRSGRVGFCRLHQHDRRQSRCCPGQAGFLEAVENKTVG